MTAVNRELGKKDEDLLSLCDKIDGKAKIQAVGKKKKGVLTSFFSCVHRVNKMKQKLMLIVLIYFFY